MNDVHRQEAQGFFFFKYILKCSLIQWDSSDMCRSANSQCQEPQQDIVLICQKKSSLINSLISDAFLVNYSCPANIIFSLNDWRNVYTEGVSQIV